MPLSNVSTKYGAPMGRREHYHEPQEGAKVYLQHVPLFDGGCYDKGGAYWGCGAPLYHAFHDDDGELFLRAANRQEAKASVRREWPDAEFFR